MDNEKDESPFIMDVIRNFATIFTLSILAISLMGIMLVRYASDLQHISALFAFEGMGLSYGVVLQIAGFSLLTALGSVIIISQRLIPKMRFALRIMLLFLSTLLIFSIFAVIFKWFPVNDLFSWLGFIVSSFICFIFSLLLTILKFKLEGKKYDKLLANYKARKNNSK